MVKGISRRVIVVDSPDPQLFEQAIFIVRNDAFSRDGVTPQQVVNEACRAAKGYTATLSGKRLPRRFPPRFSPMRALRRVHGPPRRKPLSQKDLPAALPWKKGRETRR